MPTPPNPDSILDSVKKALGFDPDYTAFDLDIVMHVNTVFGSLQQFGVGPLTGFAIADNTALWSQYITDAANLVLLSAVRTYIYLKVRLIFDPPATSFGLDAISKLIAEFEWRLNVIGEDITPPSDPTVPPLDEQLAEFVDLEIEKGWLFGDAGI
jgi:hypothetical protein